MANAPKDPRLRSRPSVPPPSISIPPSASPQQAGAASNAPLSSPSTVASPTSVYSPGSPTFPPSIVAAASAAPPPPPPPPPQPPQFPSRQNSFSETNNFRPRDDRRGRDERPRDDYRSRTDDRPRDDPRSREGYRPREDHRPGRQDLFPGYEPSPAGSSSSRHPGSSGPHGYIRDPPPDPRADNNTNRYQRNSFSGGTDKFSRPSSPARRGRSPTSNDQRRGRSPPAPRSRGTSAAPSRHDAISRGRSPPRATEKRPTSYNGVLEPPMSDVNRDTALGTRYRNPFARTEDVKTKPEPILPPPPLPPIPKSSSSSTTTSSMRTPSSTVSQGTTAPGHRYDSYLARSQSLHRSSSRARSRSRERGRSKSRAASRERDRGRSKSRARSKERDRGRSKSRAGSRERDRDRDRGRSKSRARSTARHRSMSRPRVSVVTMGEFTRKRARSPSRSRRKGDSDEDQSDSDLDSLSSASDDYLYRTRSGRSYGHRKKRRYLSSDSSDNSSDISDNDSDDTTMTRKSRPDLTRAGLPSDPMMRFNGPLTDMITKMGVVMEACTSQSEKLMAKVRKLETIKKKIDREMKELGKELRVQKMQGSGSGSPQIGQSEVVAAGGPGYFQDLSRPFGPVPVPPSLKPVASGSGGGSSSSGMVTLRIPPNVDHGASHAFPHPRASGFRRVFEKSTYTLPVSTQANLTVLSLGTKKVFESFFGGRRPGYVQINPFSHQTQFEGIAASSSMDGNIHFWDINAQKMLLSVPPRDSRVIPYAETITWVSEDAIVAVSHLKNGIKWPEPNAEPSNTELTAHSEPEAQTNLITIYFNREGQLGFRVLTITTMPHLKPITTVAAIMGEDHSVSYVTGGSDKRLFHWKFGPPDSQSPTGYEPQGLVELHQAHSNSISSTIYSHTSKLLYSGGLDGKYVSFNLEEQKVVTEQRVLGKISHIVQNPMDPRINLVGTLGYSRQYLLMDERTPTQPALTFGYRTQNATSKLSVPSWQPGGGLVCTGTNVEGTLYLWDVRWSSVRLDYRRRPGVGVVTGDGAGYAAGGKHPIFRAPLTGYDVPKTETAGAPTQIFKVAGKKVQQACFHPTKNVLLMVNSDNNLTFMDYDLRVDTVTL